jgi:hypothetical protein
MSDNLAMVLVSAISILGIVGVTFVGAWAMTKDRRSDR